MPFDWQEFLTLADHLMGLNSEAGYRSAISRAYYSVFNVARQRAERNLCRFEADMGGSHKTCWKHYKKGPDPTCMKVGVDGDRMREARVRADYKSGDYPRLAEEAQKALRDIRILTANLARLDAQYPRPD